MMYNHELILIRTETEYDDIGNPIKVEEKNPVLCQVNSIGSNEFYDAAAQGLKPEIEFVVHGYEYFGEQVVEFEGVRYSVIRVYRESFEEIELTCERDIANG
ncbi:phage head closure protein [Lentibacillus amyloliquefaciens]|uniref:Phage head-tail adapter protein n=1 Tax=Lentibacillus amyloliquefaciens TaxID=1472767 RepID=A0A0U4EBT1_9BACI|nr:phage head closure protein [Lentibacillus amyloliquefaciens]ALX50465.1 phage head-tail adapter protein [Lentibacillus amyloliquefaciens]